jgi:hypothetical protein
MSTRDWIIPHFVPRARGIITISAPAMPLGYEPDWEYPNTHEAGYFAGILEGLYRQHRERVFVVPWSWLDRSEIQARANAIMDLAEQRPVIVCATADTPHVARRFLSVSRAGMVVGHRHSIATLICGDEPGWSLSINPSTYEWTLAHPFLIDGTLGAVGPAVLRSPPKKLPLPAVV